MPNNTRQHHTTSNTTSAEVAFNLVLVVYFGACCMIWSLYGFEVVVWFVVPYVCIYVSLGGLWMVPCNECVVFAVVGLVFCFVVLCFVIFCSLLCCVMEVVSMSLVVCTSVATLTLVVYLCDHTHTGCILVYHTHTGCDHSQADRDLHFLTYSSTLTCTPHLVTMWLACLCARHFTALPGYPLLPHTHWLPPLAGR